MFDFITVYLVYMNVSEFLEEESSKLIMKHYM